MTIIDKIKKHFFKSNTRLQFLKFVSVGIINTLVSLLVIYLCMELGVNYKLSNLFGYIAGVINSFVWSKIWVFKSRDASVIKESVKFSFTFLICYTIQYLILLLFAEKLQINKYLSQLIAMGVYTVINFLMNKFFTFRNGK